MSLEQTRPRSKRSRHRGKPRAFSFLFRDGKIIEETTGLGVPSPRSITATGKLPALEHRTKHLYFDLDGRPMCEETRQILHNWFCKYLFVIDGRLRPEIPSPEGVLDTKHYHQVLHVMGLGIDAGLQPWEIQQRKPRASGDALIPKWREEEACDEAEDRCSWNSAESLRWKDWIGGTPDPLLARPRIRRPLLNIPRSDWRRTLEARLAVIFDREPRDTLIRKLAKYLSREEGWHEWWWDPVLHPFYKQAFNDKERGALVRMLEMMAFRRANRTRNRRSAKKPCRFCFSLASKTYTFALPRRSPRGDGKETIRMRAWVLAALQVLATKRPIDPRTLAAVVWKAGRYLEEPQDLRHGHLTLNRVAVHFNLTSRQVAYAALKLRAGAEQLIQSSRIRVTSGL